MRCSKQNHSVETTDLSQLNSQGRQWIRQVHNPGISELDKTNLATKAMFWAMVNDGLPGIPRLDILLQGRLEQVLPDGSSKSKF